MGKSSSIVRMEELGLNTLDYFISANKAEVLHYLSKHADEKMSLRTERGDEWMCPYYYMVEGGQLMAPAIKHLEEGYTLILAPSLDIKDCKMFGSTALGDAECDVIEYVVGSGKVRDLYKNPNRITKILDRGNVFVPFLEKDHLGVAKILNEMFTHFRSQCYDEIPCVIEWSYYNRPVGVKNENLIVWELRPYV